MGKRSLISRLEGTTKEKYIAYLLVVSEMLKIKERDNTMSSIDIINDILNRALNNVELIDLIFNGQHVDIQLEMSMIGRRHGIEVSSYDEFIALERDNKLEDLGI